MKQTFDVTGMTCAACSARVEKASNKVEGVQQATVNLLKNSMDVEYDGNPATVEAICEAVEKAGYGAAPRMMPGAGGGTLGAQNASGASFGVAGAGASAEGMGGASAGGAAGPGAAGAGLGAGNARQTAAAREAKQVRFRLIVSFIFTIPLFYLSMGHMFGWPLPSAFLGD